MYWTLGRGPNEETVTEKGQEANMMNCPYAGFLGEAFQLVMQSEIV